MDGPNDGYAGDISSSNDESDCSIGSFSNPKELHGENASVKPAPSPIHPDIDISLTTHLTSRDDASFPTNSILNKQRGTEATSHASPLLPSSPQNKMPLEILAQLLMDYFATIGPHSASRQSSSVEGQAYNMVSNSISAMANEKVVSDMRQATKRLLPDLTSLASSDNHVKPMFSSQFFFLEAALSLTQSPRLLLEAMHPHRVIHTNAAFSNSILGKSVDPQQWVEQQNSCETTNEQGKRSLSETIQEIFSNVPVTVYPVVGSGKVSHYLVEVSKEDSWRSSSATGSCSPQSSKRARKDEPSLAVG